MDKQGKKSNTISIKINGENKSYEEKLLVQDWQLGEKESAAADAEEKIDTEEFEWILPDENQNPPPQEYKKIHYVQNTKSSKKKFSPNIKGSSRIFISFVGAIAIGVLLGFITLKIITHSEQNSVPVTAPQDGAVTTEKTETPPATNTTKNPFQLAPFFISVLQGGVFSTSESLEMMEDSIAAKGIPTGALTLDGKQFLYVGVASNLETAKLLGEKIKGENIEVYAKEQSIPSKTVQVTETEKQFLEKATNIFMLLAQESANGVIMESTNASVMDSIGKAMNEINNLKLEQEPIKEMQKQLTQSFEQLKTMTAPKQAQEAQESLLSFLEMYQTL